MAVVTASRPSMPRIPLGIDRRRDLIERAILRRQRDVDRSVLGPRDVGERGFDDVADDERGGDDGRAEERPGDDQDGLRAAAADVAQGHGEEGSLAQRRDHERSQQEQRDDPEDRDGGHAITGSAVRLQLAGHRIAVVDHEPVADLHEALP